MNTNELREYLAADAMDADVKSLEMSLAEHKKHCEAQPGNCPYEKKMKAEIEKVEAPKDKADDLGGVSSGRSLKISGVVGKQEDGDREIGKAVEQIIDEARELDEYDSRSFGEACGSVSDTLAEEALEEFADKDGNLDLDAWEKGKDAWIQKNIESIDDRIGEEMSNRKSYYKEQSDYYWKTGRMPNW